MEDSEIEVTGYEIKSVLGKGGMATVYLAIQKSFGREVAVKIMAKELSSDPSFGERFLREAKIVSNLIHPNIVTVYDVGLSNGNHFLAMEYVNGVDLKAQLHELPFFHIIKVIKEVALALNYAGNKGYVHRDIKPENIVINKEDSRSVLMDFGIAKAFDSVSEMTQTGIAIGTPYYISPEQAKGKEVDWRSDIYSLGVVFFQLLTGKVPFDGDSAVSVGIKHISDPVPSLPDYLAETFQAIINKCLAKHRKDRYQNGLELINDINKINERTLVDIANRFDKLENRQPADYIDLRVETPMGFSGLRPTSADSLQFNADETQLLMASPGARIAPEKKSKKTDKKLIYAAVGSLVALLIIIASIYQFNNSNSTPTTNTALQETEDAQKVPQSKATDVEKVPLSEAAIPSEEKTSNTDSRTDELSRKPINEQNRPINSNRELELEELLTEITALENQLHKDLTVASELIRNYQQIEAIEQNHPKIKHGNNKIIEAHNAVISKLVNEGQYLKAQSALDELTRLYPDQAGSDNVIAFKETIDFQLNVQELLATADTLLANDELTSNDNNNAKYYYERVLEQSPNNKRAINGLFAITERYAVLGETTMEQGRLDRALTFVKRGLSIQQVDNERLIKLEKDIIARQEQQERSIAEMEQQLIIEEKVTRLLAEAENFFDNGILISPESANALLSFQNVLEFEQYNQQAIDGIRKIEMQLIAEVSEYIELNQFDLAGSKLDEAERALPDSTSLEEARANLIANEQKALEEAKPKIPLLSVSGSEITMIDESIKNVINADRTVHIGFTYSNFAGKTNLVQAELHDGGKTVKIRTVPVIIVGEEGEKFFKISRPVTGFPEGGYIIDIVFNDEILISSQFTVER